MAIDSSALVQTISGVPVGTVVPFQYDPTLVALSFLISVFGSFVALEMAAKRGQGGSAVEGPAIALGGCAIWAMHFIAMSAYRMPLYVSYAVVPTLASLILAVFITGLGFWLAQKDPAQFSNLLLGGLVIGIGVVVMHYLGMFGMELRATIDWNWALVAGSVAIAVAAATVALLLAFNLQTRWQRVLAAVAMGGAVSAMHYTGMAAAAFVCSADVVPSDSPLGGRNLPYFVFALTLLFLLSSMGYVWLDRSVERRQ